eukprot:1159045-Pelagomonas_calceolata.AAC.8
MSNRQPTHGVTSTCTTLTWHKVVQLRQHLTQPWGTAAHSAHVERSQRQRVVSAGQQQLCGATIAASRFRQQQVAGGGEGTHHLQGRGPGHARVWCHRPEH